MGAEAKVSDSATDTLNTGNDGRCFGPPPGSHLSELKSRQAGHLTHLRKGGL